MSTATNLLSRRQRSCEKAKPCGPSRTRRSRSFCSILSLTAPILLLTVGSWAFQIQSLTATSLHRSGAPPSSTMSGCFSRQRRIHSSKRCVIWRLLMSDDWSNFSALDDDEDIVGDFDTTDYAAEHDHPDTKAEVGSMVEPPTIDRPAPPIFVPAGTFFLKCIVTSSLETDYIVFLLFVAQLLVSQRLSFSPSLKVLRLT